MLSPLFLHANTRGRMRVLSLSLSSSLTRTYTRTQAHMVEKCIGLIVLNHRATLL